MVDGSALPSKKLRDPATGRTLGRARTRSAAVFFQRAHAAMQLLKAIVFIDDKRRLNTLALAYIDKQQRAIDEARATLLAERANIDAKAALLAQTCAAFAADSPSFQKASQDDAQ